MGEGGKNTERAVIFDLDGTLLDTLDDLAAALSRGLKAAGREDIPREKVREFVGNGVPKLIKRALRAADGLPPEGEHDAFLDCYGVFTDYYNEHSADLTRPYAGVCDAINGIKARGVRTAIVTNKYDEAAQRLCGRLLPKVDIVVGAREGLSPKPAPDGVLYALNALGSDRANAVYVGDGETDIATARAAGLPVVAVSWGFRDRELLETLAPDRIIDSPAELEGALAGLGFFKKGGAA